MEYFRLLLRSFLYVALVQMGIYASNDVPWGSYWKTSLPKTPIPKTLQELLHPENWKGGKTTYTAGMNINIQPPVPADRPPFLYGVAAPKNFRAEPNVTTYFFEKDLHVGKKMTLHFPKTTKAAAAPLLPRKVANSIPFSKSKLPQILNHFALKPNSVAAQVIKQTIEECEATSMEGEYKYCTTSLESLVDFTVSRLGKHVQVYFTDVQKESKQEFRIAKGLVQKNGDRFVVCHKLMYEYAVFYCHEILSTRTYVVPLVGADGTKVEAVAICHADTRQWNTKHRAFEVLKAKPGTVPICHFLEIGNLVWVPIPNK